MNKTVNNFDEFLEVRGFGEKDEDDVQRNLSKAGKVKCPSCGKRNSVDSDIRPLRIQCRGCNSTLRIE